MDVRHACLGVTTGALSFAWSIRQFFLTGHRVVVEVTHGFTIDPSRRPLTATWNITVRVINQGRAAVTLRDIEVEPLETDRRTAINWSDWAGSIGVPPHNFRLDAGTDQVWRIDNPERLREMLTGNPDERPLCRFVAILATGKPVHSNEVRIHFEETEGFEVRLVRSDEMHADGR